MDTWQSKLPSSITRIDHALLSDYTTFRLGGPCKTLILCSSSDELITTIQNFIREGTNYILIGSGSNIVVSDHGLQTPVIRYVSQTPLIQRKDTLITVSASTILDDLALYCVEEGLDGLNFTTGIPGCVGGAVLGNAGAWGKQVGDMLVSAVIIDSAGNVKTVSHDYFDFQYRHSRLKETQDIIVSVTFSLSKGDPVSLAKERAHILKIRSEKHPDLAVFPCAGSFFRNVSPTSSADRRQAAGWFLEQAGGKNLSVGGARIFDKHANIIIKGPACKAQDVYDLQLKMIALVYEKFGFELQREVRFVGDFNTTKNHDKVFW